MRPEPAVQYFSDEYLEHCRQLTPSQIAKWLDEFRLMFFWAQRSDAGGGDTDDDSDTVGTVGTVGTDGGVGTVVATGAVTSGTDTTVADTVTVVGDETGVNSGNAHKSSFPRKRKSRTTTRRSRPNLTPSSPSP